MLEYLHNLYGDTDFQLNLIAEAHGVIVEVVLISVVLATIFSIKENRRWRPARLNVVKEISQFHRMLFNASHRAVDPDYEIDLKAHGFPSHFTQADAVFWGKNLLIPNLDPGLERVKKLVEYNNVALDSKLMPLVSDYLVSAEELVRTTKFVLRAYDPKNRSPHSTFHPMEDIDRLSEIYAKLCDLYPELKKMKTHLPEPISSNELNHYFDIAAQKVENISYVKKPESA
ncbi:hypothetical protein [Aurantivibrio plasticivorans]